jgi:hypothetical protein
MEPFGLMLTLNVNRFIEIATAWFAARGLSFVTLVSAAVCGAAGSLVFVGSRSRHSFSQRQSAVLTRFCNYFGLWRAKCAVEATSPGEGSFNSIRKRKPSVCQIEDFSKVICVADLKDESFQHLDGMLKDWSIEVVGYSDLEAGLLSVGCASDGRTALIVDLDHLGACGPETHSYVAAASYLN